MNIQHLDAHDFTPDVIRNWKERYSSTLLPLQEQVIKKTGLLRGNNLVVFAPTSSGKTFIGEMAAVRQWQRKRKSVFLAPTKALAEEQFRHLHNLYSPLGIRVAVATAERTSFDYEITRGEFEFAVMVYEKFRVFMSTAPTFLSSLGLVVVDEMQIIGDFDRGDSIDLLLTGLASRNRGTRNFHGSDSGNSPSQGRQENGTSGKNGPQVVCLSAVLSESSRPADWLQGDFLMWPERPVELREGVLRVDTGVFKYRETNSGREDEEQLLELSGERCRPDRRNYELPTIEALTRTLCARGEQVLIFVPSRRMSHEWALNLGQSLGLDPAKEAMDSLDELEPSAARRLLEQLFQGGVASHNSDLPHPVRAIVEEQFRLGNIRVLVATSTLAQGVNLAADTVISVPEMYTGGSKNITLAPLSRQRFRNQGGRAGRLVAGDSRAERFGRSILVASNEHNAAAMWRDYIGADVEPLAAAIQEDSFDRLVLDLVDTGRATTREQVAEQLMNTYSAMILWSARRAEFQKTLNASIERLKKFGLVEVSSETLKPRALGHAAATFGIEPETARQFIGWCEEVAKQGLHDSVAEFEAIAIAAFSPDGAMMSIPLQFGELKEHRPSYMLAARTDIPVDSLTESVRILVRPKYGLCPDGLIALKKTLVTYDWVTEASTRKIEGRYELFSGTLQNLGAHIGWLVQALAAVAKAMELPEEIRIKLDDLADRLPGGILPKWKSIAGLRAVGLSRGHLAELCREGFDSMASLAEAEPKLLTRVLPMRLAKAVCEQAKARTTRKQTPKVKVKGMFDKSGAAVGGNGKDGMNGKNGGLTPHDVGKKGDVAGRPGGYAGKPGGYAGKPGGYAGKNPEAGAITPVTQEFLAAEDDRAYYTHELSLDENKRGEVWFRGKRVHLTPKPFQLLVILARNAGKFVDYNEVTAFVWPDMNIEQQQISNHMCTVMKAFAPVCGKLEAKALFTTFKGRGVQLNIPEDKVNLRGSAVGV